MLLMTNVGFYEIVRRWRDPYLSVYSHNRDHLMALKERYLPDLSEVERHGGPFRGKASPEAVGAALHNIATAIGYDYFDRELKKRLGPPAALVYSKFEEALRDQAGTWLRHLRSYVRDGPIGRHLHQFVEVRPELKSNGISDGSMGPGRDQRFELLVTVWVIPPFPAVPEEPRSYSLLRRIGSGREDLDYYAGVLTIEYDATGEPHLRERYRPVPTGDTHQLQSLLEDLRLSPVPSSDSGYLDGTSYEVRFGGFSNAARFCWSVSPPAGWEPLAALVRRLEELAANPCGSWGCGT